MLVDGEAKQSRIKTTMKWRSKCISMVIVKRASRNVAAKAGKMREAVFETQANFVTPEVGGQAVSSEHESLGDVERLHVKAFDHEVAQS